MYVLQIQIGENTLKEYSDTLDQTTSRALVDYCKRILSKLSPDSDEEEDELA